MSSSKVDRFTSNHDQNGRGATLNSAPRDGRVITVFGNRVASTYGWPCLTVETNAVKEHTVRLTVMLLLLLELMTFTTMQKFKSSIIPLHCMVYGLP